ncbi:MAG: hypothetical protein AAF990_18560 [Bacteroidota bacterium]
MHSVKYQITFLLFFLLTLLACDNDDDFGLPVNCESNNICLEIDSGTALPDTADGVTTIRLNAFIPKKASKARSIVRFTTTTGSFINVDNAQFPKDTAINGLASVVLKVGTVPGPHHVKATVSDGTESHSDRIDFNLEAIQDKVLVLTSSTDTLAADGDSEMILSAMVPNAFFDNNRKITFFAGQAGTFDNPINQDGSNNKTSLPLVAGAPTTAILRISTTPGNYTIRATLGEDVSYSCEHRITLTPLANEDVFKIDFDTTDLNNLPADGTTLVTAKITITGINPFNQMLTLESSGAWNLVGQNPANITLNRSGETTAFLRMTQDIDDCFLTASIGANTTTISTRSVETCPAFIRLVPAATSVRFIEDAVDLKAYLSRGSEGGKVSTNVPIEFEATQLQGGIEKPVGFFDPPITRTTAMEEADIRFTTTSDSAQILIGTDIKISAFLPQKPSIRDSFFIRVEQ